jgi:hypothetical protein
VPVLFETSENLSVICEYDIVTPAELLFTSFITSLIVAIESNRNTTPFIENRTIPTSSDVNSAPIGRFGLM